LTQVHDLALVTTSKYLFDKYTNPFVQNIPKEGEMFLKYQNTRYLEWSFRNGSVRYKWDKDLGECQVKWDDYIVALNLGTVEKSKVTKNNNDPSPKEYEKALEKAIGLFNNDSFWLVAPFKIFDVQ